MKIEWREELGGLEIVDGGALKFLRRRLAISETAEEEEDVVEEDLMEKTYFFKAASSAIDEEEGFFLAAAADDDDGPEEERPLLAAEVLERLKVSLAAERQRETRFWAVEAGIRACAWGRGRER